MGGCNVYICKFNVWSGEGEVLSPALFVVFVDDILLKLKKCGLCCYIKGLYINSPVYADDLRLLSMLVTHMQQMTFKKLRSQHPVIK